MELTEGQRERIKKNRERALEIRRQKFEQEQQGNVIRTDDTRIGTGMTPEKRPVTTILESNNNKNECISNNEGEDRSLKRSKNDTANNNVDTNDKEKKDDIGEELEEFEMGASEYVTKQDAMTLYCLPEGTISCCKNCIEKPNPRNANWKPMKLYLRTEIRARAHKRYGGVHGLQQERQNRKQKQYEKNIRTATDIIFK